MQRTRQKNRERSPDLIITADIHLRDDTPRCRTDDYWKAQSSKIRFIRDLQEKYRVPICDGGDLLDKWKSSPYLEGWSIDNLPEGIITVPGNHELPEHNINRLNKSSLNVLAKARKIQIIQTDNFLFKSNLMFCGFPFGTSLETINEISKKIDYMKKDKTIGGENYKFIAIIHILTYESQNLWPGLESIDGASLLRKMKGFDLIITGHNHQPFTIKYGDQLLVNPGSMMRMKADQIDHRPRVYLWYADTNEVEPVYLPIELGVVSREHLEKQEKKNERMEAWVESLEGTLECCFDVVENVEKFFGLNNTRDPVRTLLRKAMEKI